MQLAQYLFGIYYKPPSIMAIKSYYTLVYYNEVSTETQAEELYQHGEFIERYKVGENVLVLYSYHNFYIEVTYNPISNEIISYFAISVDYAADKYVQFSDNGFSDSGFHTR